MIDWTTYRGFVPPPCLRCCAAFVAVPCLECRTKGGAPDGYPTASLCGYPEYDSPSVPAKRYRTQTLSGAALSCQGSDSCPGGISGQTWQRTTLSGSYKYSAADCTITNTQSRLDEGTAHPSPACGGGAPSTSGSSIITDPNFNPASIFLSGGLTIAWTSIQKHVMADNLCGTNGPGNLQSGELWANLSDEDTAIAAVARRASILAWTAWVAGSCSGFTSLQSGIDLNFMAAQWRIKKIGLIPATSYNFSVKIWRRPYGGADPWTLDTTLALSAVTDGTGAILTPGVDLPAAVGLEYKAECDCVFALT